MDFNKVPPHDLEAEQAVLGSMFIEKEEQDNKRCGDCKYFQTCVWSRGSLDKICEEFR